MNTRDLGKGPGAQRAWTQHQGLGQSWKKTDRQTEACENSSTKAHWAFNQTETLGA